MFHSEKNAKLTDRQADNSDFQARVFSNNNKKKRN